jgi:hypothetical protein
MEFNSVIFQRTLTPEIQRRRRTVWLRAVVVDEQMQIVSAFPLFIHDGTRRGAKLDDPPGML